ncbi:50S ribosomal protein L25 [Chloroflexi bacterium TSY]|nr:50S ribosomal protein L25 [Chloroflexi bacterium TSY]
MANLKLRAQSRQLTGRRVRQLRSQGLVPVVVYGNVDQPVNLQVSAREFETTLHTGGGSQLVEIEVNDGTSHNILVREIQRHPVRHHLMHADFYAVSMRDKQQVSVPIVSVGEPEELGAGLMVLQALEQVEIEALPSDIPASIEIDISNLTLEKAISVAELPAIEGVEYLTDPEEAVFTMLATRVSEEDEEEVSEEVLEGGEEPEVVSKGKQDEEDE